MILQILKSQVNLILSLDQNRPTGPDPKSSMATSGKRRYGQRHKKCQKRTLDAISGACDPKITIDEDIVATTLQGRI